MASIWSRNKIWGGTFNTDVDVADNANNASQVPASSFFNFKFSTIVDATLTRSKYLTTVIAQSLRATLHKDEDRATGSNIGVSGTGIESTQNVYTTPEQLPEITKATNDFSTPAKSDANGTLTTTNDLFNVSTITTDRKNKRFVVNFSEAGVLFFKARTWLDSELVTKINGLIATAIAAIPSVAPLTSLISVSATQTISSTGYVDVTGLTYTTPNDGITRKYFITYKGRIFQQCRTSLASEMYVKLYNFTDNLTFDESFYAQGVSGLNTGSDAVSRNIQGYLMTIQEIAPNKTIRVAAKETVNDGVDNVIMSESVFIIQEIK